MDNFNLIDIAHLPVQPTARWFKSMGANKRRIRVIVVHDMEAPEKGDTAENVAKYFHTTDTQASAHICADNNSLVRCVADNDIAYAAPGCNTDGLHLELAGYGKQTREQWLDTYSLDLLTYGASVVEQWGHLYDIPLLHITNEHLKDGGKGIIGHYQASEVYKKSDHTDPGPNFPWDIFMQLVETHRLNREKS